MTAKPCNQTNERQNRSIRGGRIGSKLRGEDPGELVRSFAGLVDDKRTLRLLNYYDGLLPPGKSIEETPIGRLIISNAATETMDEAVRHGSVSQMKSATGLTGNDKDGQDLYARAAKELGHEGSIGIVFGSPGAGKTATTIDIAQSWRVRTGGTIIGNTTWEGFDYQIHSDVDMLETMASIDGPVLALLDEIAQELSGFGSGNKAAEKFSDRSLFIRKMEEQHGQYPKRGSMLLVGHEKQDRKKHPSGCIVRYRQAKSVRSGARDVLETPGGKDKWTGRATTKD